ncbi:MAG TPA: hypothetical protein PKL53_07570 [Methylotenera sp.]|nr:hypothetical protein [Methylotenera sp.]HPV44202.1 hypothetical protein [Methylotenera sp.]
MNKSVIALMALMMLFIAGCASSGGSAAGAGDNGGLPEIAAYDDDVVEPLPDMVPAEM